jgi:GntR family transcriptional regulator of vanillate catabolism
VLTRAVERIAALPFASPSAFVVAQSALAEAHRTLVMSQRQHHAILDAVAAGASARAEKLTREHSNLAKRSLHSAAKREAPLRKAAGGNLVRLQLAAV